MTVLLIEDEELDARIIQRLVKKTALDLEITAHAQSLAEALDLIRKDEFSIILLDLGLPDSSGPEAVSSIREINDSSGIIVLTGNDDEDTAVRAVSLGAQDYIVKSSINLDVLQRTIRYSHERISQEAVLRESNRDLNTALKTLKKAQSELVRHERMRALGQMASGVAHDFNNALAAIHANVELLLGTSGQEMPEDKKLEMLRNIRLLTEDAAQVSNRLGDYYKYSDSSDKKESVNLKNLTLNMIEITRPCWKDQAQLNGKTIHIETDLDDQLHIHGNPAELREVLTNLIFNSVDAFTKDGTISFKLYQEDDLAVLEVADTGMGMSQEQMAQCFEPYYSTKSEDKSVSGGSGLGLSMVYGIVTRHRGKIKVQTAPGQGTTFRIQFNLSSRAESSPAVQQEEPVEPRSDSARILLVEDEEPIRKALNLFLEYSGFECEQAGDGQEALEKFNAGSFDIVVTDRSMPRMNGDDLSAVIKQKSPQTPVIMLTGYGEMMPSEGPDAPPVDQILSKPCKVAVLKEIIESFLPSDTRS